MKKMGSKILILENLHFRSYNQLLPHSKMHVHFLI